MSTVRLQIADRDGNVKSDVEIDANDALTFTVDAPVRIGHLRGPAETLGNLLGTTVEFELRAQATAEPVDEPESFGEGPFGQHLVDMQGSAEA